MMTPQMKAFLGWIGAAVVIIGLHWTDGKLSAKFMSLPVDTAPVPSAEGDTQRSASLANLYPLLVQNQGPAAGGPEDMKRVDLSFRPKDEIRRRALPDYFTLLRYRIALEAVTDHGAIINGRFRALGEPLEELRYPDKRGHLQTPRLAMVSAHGIVLAVGHRRLMIPFNPD